MNKLLSTLLAGAAALALSGAAFAGDEADKARDSGKDVQNQTQGAPVEKGNETVNNDGRDAAGDPAKTANQAGGTVNEGGKDVAAEGRDPKKEEFQAELKKCDALTGQRKTTCIDTAKKKHGQM